MIPNVAPNRTISFGRHVFAPASGQLWRGAREIRLTPKAAAVLAALVARPGAILTKDDLFAAVWPGVAVSDSAAPAAATTARVERVSTSLRLTEVHRLRRSRRGHHLACRPASRRAFCAR